MFYFDRGLRLLHIPLAIDVRRGHACGFVSHAHADHYGAHQLTLCTPATARLIATRWKLRQVYELPYGVWMEWGDHRLQTWPAGHILGSAMLYVETPGGRLLYTGDFQLRGSLTSEPAKIPQADVLIMESTYGHPRYRFPSRDALLDQLATAIDTARHRGLLPVVRGYQVGKAQEITRALNLLGYFVVIDPRLARVHQVYNELGVDLGPYHVCDGEQVHARTSDAVVVVPPPATRGRGVILPQQRYEIVVSGWAMDRNYRRVVAADAYVPWSDHADFDELMECVERTGAKFVYCLHGQEPIIEQLQRRGVRAEWLTETTIAPRTIGNARV